MKRLIDMIPEQYREQAKATLTMSSDEYARMMCDAQNKIPGNLEGIDCHICLNKGYVFYVRNGVEACKECECMEKRRSLMRIKASGLAHIIERYTLETYIDAEPWQKAIKQSAKEFITDHNGKWFFIGGQPGAGKTHICTAIVGELINQGLSARYIRWLDDGKRLKANVNDDEEYYRLINPLKTVDVLYIDDLFKSQIDEKTGKMLKPSEADIKLAFEIIDYRYMQPNAVTVISSQYTLSQIIDIDDALGSRIYERAKEYHKAIAQDVNRNYRLRSVGE